MMRSMLLFILILIFSDNFAYAVVASRTVVASRAIASGRISISDNQWIKDTLNWGQTGVNLNSFYTFTIHKGAMYAGGRHTGSSSINPHARLLRSTDGIIWTDISSSINLSTSDNEIRRTYSASDGYLYIATQRGAGAQIYRSLNGQTGWALVATLSGDADYGRWFVEYSGYIYLATIDNSGTTAARIYRAPLTDGTSWSQAYIFPDANISRCQSLMVANGYLYATTDDGGYGGAGGVFRTSDGTTWTRINNAQFNTTQRTLIVHSMIKFKGLYYVGTQDTTNGGNIWMSGDEGITWTKTKQFSVDEKEVYRIKSYGSFMMTGTAPATGDGRIYTSINGTDWHQIGEDGLGDNNYKGILDFSDVFNNYIITSHRLDLTSTDYPSKPFRWPKNSRIQVDR